MMMMMMMMTMVIQVPGWNGSRRWSPTPRKNRPQWAVTLADDGQRAASGPTGWRRWWVFGRGFDVLRGRNGQQGRTTVASLLAPAWLLSRLYLGSAAWRAGHHPTTAVEAWAGHDGNQSRMCHDAEWVCDRDLWTRK